MGRRNRTLAVTATGLACLLAACSGGRAVSSSIPGPLIVTGPGHPALVLFVHPSGWWIDSPGTMSANGDGAAYTGTSDFLRVTPLAGSSEPGRVASAEAASPLGPDFALARGPHAVRVAGKMGSEYEYRQDAGPGEATGEVAVVQGIRLYVPYSGGVYRVEYGATGAAWDLQTATAIVASFRTAPKHLQ
jgi:hypothetical protein